MITCGIDASSSCTGIGIFNDMELVYYDKIKPKEDLGYRNNACQIIDMIIPILKKYKVEKVYMEDIPQFVKQGTRGGNVLKTLCVLGVVQGVFYQKIVYENSIEVEYVGVDQWRQEMGFLLGKDRKREQQKAKAVNYVNEHFGLDLYFVEGKKSVKDCDDIAEGILICWSQIRNNKKKQFGRK